MQVLRKQQWVALALLTAGVGLVQYHEAGGAMAGAAAGGLAAGGISSAVAIGAAAVLASSLLSGFAVRRACSEHARGASLGPPFAVLAIPCCPGSMGYSEFVLCPCA